MVIIYRIPSIKSLFGFHVTIWVLIIFSLFISFTILCTNLHAFCKGEVSNQFNDIPSKNSLK